MEYTVMIQPHRGGFSALIPTLPECRAQGKTEQEAINKVREKVQKLTAKTKFATITVSENGHTHEEDPWLAMAGKWADDPTWDEYQRLIKKYRKRPRGRKLAA